MTTCKYCGTGIIVGDFHAHEEGGMDCKDRQIAALNAKVAALQEAVREANGFLLEWAYAEPPAMYEDETAWRSNPVVSEALAQEGK